MLYRAFSVNHFQNTRFVKHTFRAILSQSTHDTRNIILVIIFRNTEFEKYEFADTTFRTHGSLNLRSSQLTNASYEASPSRTHHSLNMNCVKYSSHSTRFVKGTFCQIPSPGHTIRYITFCKIMLFCSYDSLNIVLSHIFLKAHNSSSILFVKYSLIANQYDC